MTIETDLDAALKALVSNRAYPNKFPQEVAEPTWPAIRYTKISVSDDPTLCGNDDATADPHYQIDIVVRTHPEIEPLRAQVITSMAAFDPPAIKDGEFNDFDAETKTHRCTLDYIIYPSSEA